MEKKISEVERGGDYIVNTMILFGGSPVFPFIIDNMASVVDMRISFTVSIFIEILT